MRKLVYDVAMTLDGYIAHEDGSVDGFAMEGEFVADYRARLETYDTVVMGRSTYTAGYAYGLPPGQRAYPHMAHYIFSKTLRFGPEAAVDVVTDEAATTVARLKGESGGTIYLCGGGAFAGHLLDHGLIDEVLIKLNPIVIGRGIPLFGGIARRVPLRRVASKSYDSGVTLLHYAPASL